MLAPISLMACAALLGTTTAVPQTLNVATGTVAAIVRQQGEENSAAKTLRQRGQARFPRWNGVKTVLYPFSGVDAALGFQLFPAAETVIALEESPFTLGAPDKAPLTPTVERLGSWMYWRDVHGGGSMAPRLLGTLASSIPGFRLRSVQALRHQSRKLELEWLRVFRPTPAQLLQFQAMGLPIVHGLIEFDTGPGTPVRRYLHLNVDLEETRALSVPQVQRQWWWSILQQAQPGALIVKGAMSRFNPSEAIASICYSSLRAAILGLLEQNEAISVEDTNEATRNQWEFSGLAVAGPLPDFVNGVVVDDVAFGYSDKALLRQYQTVK